MAVPRGPGTAALRPPVSRGILPGRMRGLLLPLLLLATPAAAADTLDGPSVARRTPTVRARFAWPQQAAFAAGVVFHRQPERITCDTVCPIRGWHLQGEAGTAGGQLAFGWTKLVGQHGPRFDVLSRPYMAFAVRGALLRTWGNSTLTPKERTFAGVEGAWSVARISLALSVMRDLDDDREGSRWLVGGGLGWGF